MYRKYLMRRWFNKYRLYYSKHLKEIIALQEMYVNILQGKDT